MAGIAGILSKRESLDADSGHRFAKMMQALRFSDAQRQQTYISPKICFGNCLPISCSENSHYQYHEELGIHAVIDGLVFVPHAERSQLSKRYSIHGTPSAYGLIPLLYHAYKEDFVRHITGWYNIFIYDEKQKLSLLVNDQLGFYPLYYYDSDACFVFASKIEAILATGLLPSVAPDPVTIAEHLFVNYPLSDYTYIQNIHTLANAETISIRQDKTTRRKYWSMGALYDYSPADKEQSFRMMDQGLSQALHKMLATEEHQLNVSLTGGWDSRVVLSYLLPEHRDQLKLYSFGAEDADDIVVPQTIASAESLDYTPYVLDRNYLDQCFMPEALKTIALSNGTRNYKRTHYLYAVRKIAEISPFLVTGIFGDEVFKVGRPTGGDVLSKNTIAMLASDFDIDHIMGMFSNSLISDCLQYDPKNLADALRARIEALKRQMDEFDTISQKYYSIRFEYNLRKYFGSEANSYNDFVFCFSPFIDIDFLENFARTRYFGIHYSFDSNSIRLKKQSTQLYHDIVQANYPPLTTYHSARGYSMKDATTLSGNLKILCQKYLKNRKKVDGFNTKPADGLFNGFLEKKQISSYTLKIPDNDLADVSHPDLLSLIYWLGMVEENYTR